MDATLCTLIVLLPKNTTNEPYIIANDYNCEDDRYYDLLQSTFGKVYIQQTFCEVIQRLQQNGQSRSTLLLVDLDICLDTNGDESATHSVTANNKPVNLHHIATRHNHIIRYLKDFIRDLKASLPVRQIPPIVVCSRNDSPDLMLDCINAGATDYILKPLYPNVMKTLFLKLHQSRAGKNDGTVARMPTPLSTPPPPLLLPQQQSLPSSPTSVYKTLFDRINDMNSKETHLSQIILDNFAPRVKATASVDSYNHYNSISKERFKELEERVSSWDFSPFDFDQQELIHCVYLIFDKVLSLPELVECLTFDRAQFHEFILELASAYHAENPYHNFAHAVDVLQCLFYVLCRLDILPFAATTTKTSRKQKVSLPSYVKQPRDVLRPQDVFALLIAAIGHDAAHPGVNNMFLINSTNPLATLYNDRSVLESLHSTTLFQLLSKHQILPSIGDATSKRYKEFRRIVVSSILATDMSLHLDYVSKIKEQANRFRTNHLIELDDFEQERVLLCTALIKCADISNVARPFHLSHRWANLLIEEFVCQGDLEKELHLPVLPMNDRDSVVLEDSQIGFIRFVALGLFESFEEICGEPFSFTTDQMLANLKQWEERKLPNTVQHDSGVSDLMMEEENDTASVGTEVIDDRTLSTITMVQEQQRAPSQRQEKARPNSATHVITAETGSKRASDSTDKADVKRLSCEKSRIKRRTSSTSSASFYSLQQLSDTEHASSKPDDDRKYNMLEMQQDTDCLYSATLPTSPKSSLHFFNKAATTTATSSLIDEQPSTVERKERRRPTGDGPASCQCCIQ